MKQWHEIPAVFKKNILLSFTTAIGSLLITVTVFFVTGDRILLYLGLLLFLLCILKTVGLVITVFNNRYEVALGICGSIESPMFFQNIRIHITLTTGNILTLTLNRRHHFRKEEAYLLYFKKGTPLETPGSLWMQKAQTDALLAYEQIETEKLEELKYI